MANTITINVLGDVSKFQNAMKGVNNDLGALGTASTKAGNFLKGSFKAIGVGAGVAAVGIAKFGKDSITAASDLNETISKTKTIFGKASPEILKWGQNAATSIGMSENEALTGLSTFGNFFDQIGIGTKQSAEMSKQFVQMSADLGSFHNAAPVDVMEALAGATRGEYDALQKYIPTINAAAVQQKAMAMTGKTTTDALTDQDKALALNKLAMEGMGAAAGDFSRTSGSLANQQKILSAQFEKVKTTVGTALLPIVQQLMGYLLKEGVPVLQRFGEWFKTEGPAAIESVVGALKNLWTIVQPVITFIGQNAGTILTLVAGFYALVGVIALINTAMAVYQGIMTAVRVATIVWTNAQFALNIAMTLNPIGLVIAAIVALVAIFVVAYKKSETFRDIIDATWNAIKSATVAVWNFIANLFEQIWDDISETVTDTVDAIDSTITTVWNAIKSVTNTVWNAIKTATSTVWNAIKTIFTTVWNAIDDTVTTTVNAVKTVITTVWDAIKTATSTVWNAIENVIDTVVGAIKTVIQNNVNFYKTIITGAWDVIKTATSAAWGLIKDYIITPITAAYNTVSDKVGSIKSAITEAWNTAKSKTTEVWNGIKSKVVEMIGEIVGKVQEIKGKITGAFSGAASWLSQAGKNIIQGLINGIKSMASAAVNAAKDVVGDAIAGAKNLLGIKSPSKVFREFGRYTVEGLAIGLGDKTEKVVRASANLAKDVAKGFEAPQLSLSGKTSLAGAGGMGRTYEVNVNVSPTADRAAIGREIVRAIDDFERTGGKSRA